MTAISLSHDAMTVLGLAGTALPFAESIDDEVERWLRPLRLYGEAGASLQALGVGETGRSGAPDVAERPAEHAPQQTLHLVTAAASQIAAARGVSAVGTRDLLLAVMAHYGEAFDRALDRRSCDSAELMQRLGAAA